MLDEREFQILCHLRENSRQSMATISRKTNIPISTIFDKLKRLKDKIIIKHTSLIDFSKLGFNIKVAIFVKAYNRVGLKGFLTNHKNINTFQRITNYDYFIEAIFRTIGEFYSFRENIQTFSIEKSQHYFIEEDIKKEGMLLK